jgi:hypothetical protein
MKLVTYVALSDEPSLGMLHAGRVYDVAGLGASLGLFLPSSMINFLEMGEEGRTALNQLLEYVSVGIAPALAAGTSAAPGASAQARQDLGRGRQLPGAHHRGRRRGSR